ncbi:hypothetical protein GGX14DRAFT_447903 [Mycena pura]|uniref:Aminoglycoside phosphotransferase domain-containing protein n=1 Tax=Mycena pura TaxID=153505 RepID=A0AAD6VNS2_9AGAR|nr:hypothetical protein GGX14DRAFT_447903 [Mycena pura]
MESVRLTSAEIKQQCHDRLRQRPPPFSDDKSNYVVLCDKYGQETEFAVKIADAFSADQLQYDLAMMQFFKNGPASDKYTTPTGYGILEDTNYSFLVMERLSGQTTWERMNNGADDLSPADATAIAEALEALQKDRIRSSILIRGNKLTPLTHWHPQGQLFGYDNDGGRMVDDRDDFHSFLKVRFEEAEVDPEVVSVTTDCLAHGEPSPHNLIHCPDGRIAFLDLRTTFLAPRWWDYYAVHRSIGGSKYSEPLKRAMERCGMGIDQRVLAELDDKFLPWFCRLGGAWARRENKERETQGRKDSARAVEPGQSSGTVVAY